MREEFGGFYGISEEVIEQVLKSENTIFIFDTNILLTLYRCEEETRNQFFKIWEKVKDNCWFPHHVCLEYQRNRLVVVKGSRDSLNSIPKEIKNTIKELRGKIYGNSFNQTVSRYSKLRSEIDSLFESFDRVVESFTSDSIDVRNSKIDFFTNHDVIRDEIDKLTAGKIGPAPATQAVIDELNKTAKIRYKYKTGPGFEDSSDKKNDFYSFGGVNYDAEYGDYYVWSQILEYIDNVENKNVVYVTNDAKSDFFYKLDGKVRGPNESLISEIKKRGATEFLLQNIDAFLHHANKHLNVKVEQETITELSNASNANVSARFKNKKKYRDYILKGRMVPSYNLNEEYDHFLRIKNNIFKCQRELDELDRMSSLSTSLTGTINVSFSDN